MRKNKIKALSLFANIGVAECYLKEVGIEVCVANEIDSNRAKMYEYLYPETEMIIGDITNPHTYQEIIQSAKASKINLIIATPPCQGMSTAGKKEKNDKRNYLIQYAVQAVKDLKPQYVLFENVPEQLITEIIYKNKTIKIPEYLKNELEKDYFFSQNNIVNAADYGVPQLRERAIFLLTKKVKDIKWDIPKRNEKKITMEEAIGSLPSLDPEIYDIPYKEMLSIFPEYEKKKAEGMKVSKWHIPPKHVKRQVIAMMHTPTGKSAFENEDTFKPLKIDGTFVKGYKNTYKRQNWDTPAYTITMYNRTIGSQNNVHPGRFLGTDSNNNKTYSDARVLTIFEIMKVMSIPENWNIPDWATENFIRSVIGEGIPPLLVKKIFEVLPDEL